MKSILILALVACSAPAQPEQSYACHILYTCDRDTWGPSWVEPLTTELVQERWLTGERLCEKFEATYVCKRVTDCMHTCDPLIDGGL